MSRNLSNKNLSFFLQVRPYLTILIQATAGMHFAQFSILQFLHSMLLVYFIIQGFTVVDTGKTAAEALSLLLLPLLE
jgi:hypothetical protein